MRETMATGARVRGDWEQRQRVANERRKAAAERLMVRSSFMHDDFPTLLRDYRERDGISRNGMAKRVGVDPSYLTRIEQGEREAPRQHIIMAITRYLRLTTAECNRLLASAGYVPATVTQIGTWDDALQAVVDVLVDFRIAPDERDRFRTTVIAIAAHWSKL